MSSLIKLFSLAKRLSAGIESKNYSGHSLRSGFATSAAESGAEERSIMAMTGHKSGLPICLFAYGSQGLGVSAAISGLSFSSKFGVTWEKYPKVK